MSQVLRPRRVGVFGGAFDPPHQAHVALARAALAQLGLDELRIFPTGDAWHKTRRLSAASDRLAMARLAFEGLPGAVVDERELSREGPSYTIDTLEALAAEAPGAEFVLLMGGDQWAAFTGWHRWQDIATRARLCVLARPGSAEALPAGLAPPLQLVLPPMDVSATALREALADGHLSPEEQARLLPEAVARYISTHGLYGHPQPGLTAPHA